MQIVPASGRLVCTKLAICCEPITTGMKKYGKRLIAPDRVWEYGGYAFRNLKSGVPGPVHLDFPGEVARARFTDPTKLAKYQDMIEIKSDEHRTLSSRWLGDDGQWTHFMTSHYRRAK